MAIAASSHDFAGNRHWITDKQLEELPDRKRVRSSWSRLFGILDRAARSCGITTTLFSASARTHRVVVALAGSGHCIRSQLQQRSAAYNTRLLFSAVHVQLSPQLLVGDGVRIGAMAGRALHTIEHTPFCRDRHYIPRTTVRYPDTCVAALQDRLQLWAIRTVEEGELQRSAASRRFRALRYLPARFGADVAIARIAHLCDRRTIPP